MGKSYYLKQCVEWYSHCLHKLWVLCNSSANNYRLECKLGTLANKHDDQNVTKTRMSGKASVSYLFHESAQWTQLQLNAVLLAFSLKV